MGADLSLALELADAADAIALRAFGSQLVVERKADLTPVTEADRAVETEVRRLLAEARPEDTVFGEEYGSSGSSPRRWIVDPIDGTRNFVRSIPVWATLIALEEAGHVQVGVVSAPALGHRWWAERGSGAFADDRRIQVSRIDRVEEAVLSFPLDQPLPEIAFRAWHARGFGDFWAHVLVAEGVVDGAIDALGVGEWDLAAIQIVVEEAGGRFSDFTGAPRLDSGSAITSNGLLHDDLLASLAAAGAA